MEKPDQEEADRREALRVLRDRWGACQDVPAHEIFWLEQRALPEEDPLDTCARLAGVSLRGVGPFDHDTIRIRCSLAEAHHEVVMAKQDSSQ